MLSSLLSLPLYFTLLLTEVAAKFFSACKQGDVDTIKHLLKHEPYAKRLVELTNSEEPNAKKIAERTIYTATLRGHYAAAKVLLEAGANARVNTGYGTPIYAAAKTGSLDLVRLLIEYRADFQSNKRFSPLFVACIEGRLNILNYLVDRGANLSAFNPPLVFTACTAGQLEVLKFLMEEMEFNIRHTMSGQDYTRTDGNGKDTLLWCACKSNKLEVASYLVKCGAPITHTIFTTFPVIIKHILQQKLICPVGKSLVGKAEQQYHARFKGIGLVEIPWTILADYSDRLTKVELRANSLTSLPDQIFQMPVLKVLDVSNNALAELCQEEVEWECLQ